MMARKVFGEALFFPWGESIHIPRECRGRRRLSARRARVADGEDGMERCKKFGRSGPDAPYHPVGAGARRGEGLRDRKEGENL